MAEEVAVVDAMEALVSPRWLAGQLDAPDIRVLDASWHMPASGRNARAEFANCRIPGARFFDIDAISDQDTDLPHMLPDAQLFATHVNERLGIADDTRIVVYDNSPLLSAARAWWMFRVFGHNEVAVLDGGLSGWLAEGMPVAEGEAEAASAPSGGVFTARLEPALLRSLQQLRDNLAGGTEQVLDARSAGRFAGRDPEPRPGLRGGHVPGSLNLPFNTLIDVQSGRLLPDAELRPLFESAGVDLSRPVVTSCGSGITACVLALGLHLIGHERVAVYDGSWSEWGANIDVPVEAG